MGIVTIKVSQDGATLSVDHGLVGTTPLREPIFLSPGEHLIEAVLGSTRATSTLSEQGLRGAVGSTNNGARGLKVMNAYAIAVDGTPVGLLGQKWWRREARAKRSDCQDRTVNEKETRYWLSAIRGSELCLSAAGARAWFQLDREGDRYARLKALNESQQCFTVRSTYGHRFLVGQPRTRRLRHAVGASKVRSWFQLDVPAKFNRPGRHAMMAVRTTSVVLEMVGH